MLPFTDSTWMLPAAMSSAPEPTGRTEPVWVEPYPDVGVARQLEQEYPASNTGNSVTIQPLVDRVMGQARTSVSNPARSRTRSWKYLRQAGTLAQDRSSG